LVQGRLRKKDKKADSHNQLPANNL